MPLGLEDFMKAQAGHPLDIPAAAFTSPEDRDWSSWPDNPDLRRAVEWFKSIIGQDEWLERRDAAFARLYGSAYGLPSVDERGRFFDDTDTFGWYLFLADAVLDHMWNFEPIFGSRIIPIFETIGRDLDLLDEVAGSRERAERLAGKDRRQPNGGLFELLVAAAYKRAGADVTFRDEQSGIAKTHDLDVRLGGRELAVECKRLETGQYGEKERSRMRQIWAPVSDFLGSIEKSTFCNVDFYFPVLDVDDNYLIAKAVEWLESGRPSLLWKDEISEGVIGDLDLTPLQEALKYEEVLAAGTRFLSLLNGRYIRHANYVQSALIEHGMSPRYVSACDLAILLRWQSSSSEAISGKARDGLAKVSEANSQLPNDKPGIIHIGFEAVEGDDVERARYEKILGKLKQYDPRGKPLEYVYFHYLVPESPAEGGWTFNETVQWIKIAGTAGRPLTSPLLVMSHQADSRDGPHWQTDQF